MVSYVKSFFKTVLGYLGLYNKKANLLFLGLDNAGKTTLLHMLKNDRMTQTAPTIHPHSEELKMGNIRFNTFDLGGHETARKIWKDYFPAVDGILFLVDSADVKRFSEVKEELDSVLNTPELHNIPIAILANKIDKNGAASEEEIREALDINGLFSKDTRPMELFMCSVIRKIGYSKALEWLSGYLKDN
jgi:GTP-binding protein SAR1